MELETTFGTRRQRRSRRLRWSWRRAGLAAAAAALLTLTVAATSFAAAPYPPPPDREIEIIITTPKAQVRIVGSNWGPGTDVFVSTPGTTTTAGAGGAEQQGVTVTADERGSFAVTLPAPERVGTYEIVASGRGTDGAPRTETFALDVRDAAAVTDTVSEPGGGLEVWHLLVAGLVVGGALTATAARAISRRSASA